MRMTIPSALALLLLCRSARADDDAAPAAPPPEPPSAPVATDPASTKPERDVAVHETSQKHAPFARWEIGRLGTSIGAGYIHLWEQADSLNGLGGIVWFGAGVDGRLFVAHDPGRVAGAGGFASGRISFMGDAGGMSIEVAAGGADLDARGRAIATAGGALSFLYADIGYAYQFPIDGLDRANAIASHMFSLRVTVPVYTYDRQVTKTKLPPRVER
jgi:hypothetical protein